jgi:hypothetical protein
MAAFPRSADDGALLPVSLFRGISLRSVFFNIFTVAYAWMTMNLVTVRRLSNRKDTQLRP